MLSIIAVPETRAVFRAESATPDYRSANNVFRPVEPDEQAAPADGQFYPLERDERRLQRQFRPIRKKKAPVIIREDEAPQTYPPAYPYSYPAYPYQPVPQR